MFCILLKNLSSLLFYRSQFRKREILGELNGGIISTEWRQVTWQRKCLDPSFEARTLLGPSLWTLSFVIGF